MVQRSDRECRFESGRTRASVRSRCGKFGSDKEGYGHGDRAWNELRKRAAAHDADDRIIYDGSTGALS
jgi:hypothetical protein